jgi:Predicted N-acetylglucosaminyl transferase
MKPLFRKVFLFVLFLSFTIAGIPQVTESIDFPVTSSSPQAQELYKAGMLAFSDVHLNKAFEYFKKANEAEPNFIMPNVWMAFYYFYTKDIAKFKEHAGKVLSSTYKLNDSEIAIREALKKLMADPIANVTSYGEKLVQLNPKSFRAYQILSIFQGFEGDWPKQSATYREMLKLTNDPAPVYNALGYNSLEQNNIDEALPWFEKYLAAAPKNPNAYDSMGDYYAKAQDYQKAHTYYHKAFRMDSINFKMSYEKAEALKDKIGY